LGRYRVSTSRWWAGPTTGDVHTAGLQSTEPLSPTAGSGVATTAKSAAQHHTAALTILFVLIADLLSELSASRTRYVPRPHVARDRAKLGF